MLAKIALALIPAFSSGGTRIDHTTDGFRFLIALKRGHRCTLTLSNRDGVRGQLI
jgi:hypothetical protein